MFRFKVEIIIDEEKVVVTDDGFSFRRSRAIDVTVFPENIVVADL